MQEATNVGISVGITDSNNVVTNFYIRKGIEQIFDFNIFQRVEDIFLQKNSFPNNFKNYRAAISEKLGWRIKNQACASLLVYMKAILLVNEAVDRPGAASNNEEIN